MLATEAMDTIRFYACAFIRGSHSAAVAAVRHAAILQHPSSLVGHPGAIQMSDKPPTCAQLLGSIPIRSLTAF